MGVSFSTESATHTINIEEAQWVADQLASLIRQIDPQSPLCMVLDHARQEAKSLTRQVEQPRLRIAA